MNKERTNYINTLTETINERLAPTVKASFIETTKNNSAILPGFRFDSMETNISPIIYIDELLEKDIDVSLAAEIIITQFLNTDKGIINPALNDMLSDKEFIKDNVYPMLTKDPNKDWATIRFLNLQIAFYIRIDDFTTTMVTEKLLEHAGLDLKEIRLSSTINEGYHTRFASMLETLNTIMPGVEDEYPDDIMMYILTNDKGFRGASQITDRHVLEMIAKRLDNSFYIIPSSIHEVIILPYNVMISTNAIKEMIQSINSTVLDPKDVLCDSLYLYVADDPMIKIM